MIYSGKFATRHISMRASRDEHNILVSLKNIHVPSSHGSILNNIALDVRAGEIITLIGPNGAGKTTLIRVVLGLAACNGSRWVRPGLKIGYMPQRLELNSQLPITVMRFLESSNASPDALQMRMRQTGIEDIANNPMHSVSGGELQRVLLARALARNPELLVLDEPAQGVDIHGQAEMYNLIHRIRVEQDCAILMVSHDLHWVMAQTNKVICINQHVCCEGHPDHISQHPAFIELFGREVSESLAPYTHHHDHEHDLHGNVLHRSSCDHHNREGTL